MKKLFAIAFLASAFTFASCGSKTAETTTTTPTDKKDDKPAVVADNSLSGRAATVVCNCPAMKEMVALGKEIEANKDNKEKAMELTGKIMGIAPKIQECTKDIDAEVEKLPEAEKAAFQTEIQGKIQQLCPEMMPKK